MRPALRTRAVRARSTQIDRAAPQTSPSSESFTMQNQMSARMRIKRPPTALYVYDRPSTARRSIPMQLCEQAAQAEKRVAAAAHTSA